MPIGPSTCCRCLRRRRARRLLYVFGSSIVGDLLDYTLGGEVPMAFVVLKADTAERVGRDFKAAQDVKRSIVKHVADNKVAYKHLAGGVEFLPSIPVSPSGKLLRRVLREKARAMKIQSAPKL